MRVIPNFHLKSRDLLLAVGWILFQVLGAGTRLGTADTDNIALAALSFFQGLSLTPLFVTLAGNDEARRFLMRELERWPGRLVRFIGFGVLVFTFGLSTAFGRHLLQGEDQAQQVIGAAWLIISGLCYAGLAVAGFIWLRGKLNELRT